VQILLRADTQRDGFAGLQLFRRRKIRDADDWLTAGADRGDRADSGLGVDRLVLLAHRIDVGGLASGLCRHLAVGLVGAATAGDEGADGERRREHRWREPVHPRAGVG
jgi:hypothetical protein